MSATTSTSGATATAASARHTWRINWSQRRRPFGGQIQPGFWCRRHELPRRRANGTGSSGAVGPHAAVHPRSTTTAAAAAAAATAAIAAASAATTATITTSIMSATAGVSVGVSFPLRGFVQRVIRDVSRHRRRPSFCGGRCVSHQTSAHCSTAGREQKVQGVVNGSAHVRARHFADLF